MHILQGSQRTIYNSQDMETAKRPLTEGRIKMTYVCIRVGMHVCTHAVEYYSVIKKNETMPFAAIWMYLGIIILSKSDGEGQIPYDVTYIRNLNNNANISMTEKQTRRCRNRFVVARGWGRRTVSLGLANQYM